MAANRVTLKQSRLIALRRAVLAAVSLLAGTDVALAQRTAPSWTKGATCYEIFVRSFADSDGDGIGDIPGLISRLDYINDGNPKSTTSLGARCIWLMPVMESPSYHGYDQTDYYRVEKDYGTNADFKRLTAAAHQRGIRVLVDMVLNHSSNQHPYFLEALRDTTSPYRKWYRFASPKPVDQGQWIKSPVRDEYYYAVFGRSQPDLDYTNPDVVAEANKIAKFWIEQMGVDGFRLDAVPYLVEENGKLQGTGATHKVLHDYEDYVRSLKPDAYNIGEVWAPHDVVMTYYPDQLDGYFAFELADSLISGVKKGSARGILPPLLRLQRDIPAGRYAPFLRNHDQTRTRTEFGGDMSKARIASFLLLTMPGLPFVYYGEEIGMVGAKPDPRLRTPMQWSTASSGGFTSGKPWQALQSDSATSNVATQTDDPASILNLHRTLIHLRTSTPLGDGTLVPLTTSNDAVIAYLRRDGNRSVLVVANLGADAASGVTLASSGTTLPAGHWTTRSLLGGSAAAPLNVTSSGALNDYMPLPTLAAREGYLFELRAAAPR